jgi:hypothetical protein
MRPSQSVTLKAAEMFAAGLGKAAPIAQTFRVKGYVVTLEEGREPVCTCAASYWMCSHVGCAMLVRAERDDALAIAPEWQYRAAGGDDLDGEPEDVSRTVTTEDHARRYMRELEASPPYEHVWVERRVKAGAWERLS